MSTMNARQRHAAGVAERQAAGEDGGEDDAEEGAGQGGDGYNPGSNGQQQGAGGGGNGGQESDAQEAEGEALVVEDLGPPADGYVEAPPARRRMPASCPLEDPVPGTALH
jgi:hypothetical protein